jgi:hypothetical protein
MSTAPPAPLVQSFTAAAGELGQVSASRLFIRTCAAHGGAAAVADLKNQAGAAFPILDTAAQDYLETGLLPPLAADHAIGLLSQVASVVVVGFESEPLDLLVPALPKQRILVLTHAALPGDWERMLANYRGRVQAVDLDGILDHAGPDSALLCFVTGGQGHTVYVPSAWLRVHGPDTRTVFARLVAWNLLPRPFDRYPRWQAEVPSNDFTDLIG